MGGADLFVMIILGLADSSVHPLFYSLFSIMGMEPLIIMLFASLIIFISAIVNFIRYYRYTTGLPMSKRIILAISGRRMKVKDFINSKFLFPLSEIDDNGNENLRTSFSVEEDDKEWRDRYAKLVANGIVSEDKMVWVAYGIPVLPFILFGYIISLIVGIPI
jgi:preflagellin peptidase FlaK